MFLYLEASQPRAKSFRKYFWQEVKMNGLQLQKKYASRQVANDVKDIAIDSNWRHNVTLDATFDHYDGVNTWTNSGGVVYIVTRPNEFTPLDHSHAPTYYCFSYKTKDKTKVVKKMRVACKKGSQVSKLTWHLEVNFVIVYRHLEWIKGAALSTLHSLQKHRTDRRYK